MIRSRGMTHSGLVLAIPTALINRRRWSFNQRLADGLGLSDYPEAAYWDFGGAGRLELVVHDRARVGMVLIEHWGFVADGLGDDEIDVIYVGCLKEEIHPNEQDEVSQILLETFKCVPTFLPPDLFSRYYHGFCKQQMWPLFHHMLPLSPDLGGRFNHSLWQVYVSVNKIFADRIMEVINPKDDFVWVHDYHLMVLPTFLRKRFNRVKLGFFLHSPFLHSTFLNSDLIGFHTFDYARHFFSCCSRMLGLSFESKRGYIGLEYYGRTVSIKILPVRIHMGQLQSVLSLSETEAKVAELIKQFCDQGRILLLGVDDMDIFKGISLKLLGPYAWFRRFEV
ncbi:hypothetical protein F0562_011355 [Nyssa sinensis]|uniref:Uncharacterized protein n=1 Tax=Nyssa sinensis TaxID=561372 RepID=A0A5J5A6P0_9ASTE|nr:hypothetical protein F0562_011355 [Nyssa sinensis]